MQWGCRYCRPDNKQEIAVKIIYFIFDSSILITLKITALRCELFLMLTVMHEKYLAALHLFDEGEKGRCGFFPPTLYTYRFNAQKSTKYKIYHLVIKHNIKNGSFYWLERTSEHDNFIHLRAYVYFWKKCNVLSADVFMNNFYVF